MAWTTPRTWVSGELVTAAIMNSAVRDDLNILKTPINNSGELEFTDATELTIASGVITVTQNYHKVDTQGDAASDDLDTITAGTDVAAGFILHLRVESAARTVVIKNGTGGADNLDIGADVTLDESYKTYSLVYDGADWRPWTFAEITSAGGSDTQIQFNDGGSAFGGDAGLTYNKTTDSMTMASAGEYQPSIHLNTTDASTGVAFLRFLKDSASPAIDDALGKIDFFGDNDAGSNIRFAFILSTVTAVTAGSEAARFDFYSLVGGSNVKVMAVGENVIIDGKLGIGTTVPDRPLEVVTSDDDIAVFNSTATDGGRIEIERSGTRRVVIGTELAIRVTAGSSSNGCMAGSHSGDGGHLTLWGNYNVASSGVGLSSAGLYPMSDNAISSGASSNRWTDVWAVSGSVNTSDEREKRDIVDSYLGLDFINRLRPVSYRRRTRTGDTQFFGLIAQEVDEVVPPETGFVAKDNPDSWGLRYTEFTAPMIKAIQELDTRIQELEAAPPEPGE
jgi:hypothetical protein